jgi:type IV pilus assembly protein PilX
VIKHSYLTSKKIMAKQYQSGLVLFVALVALVAMSLAAAALVRSVDTGTLIAGNLAFKQSATMSADSGVTAAYDFFNNIAKPALATNAAYLDTQKASYGYIANFNALRLSGINKITDDAVWTNTWSRPAIGNGNDASGKDSSGNTVRYVIERMCNADGKFNLGNGLNDDDCLIAGTAFGDGDSKKQGGKYDQNLLNTSAQVTYRVTARVQGPKNTVSFVQTFIY